MALSQELISQFAKITKDDNKTPNEATVYGTAVEYNDKMYVKLDGSDLLTPASTTADISNGDRVTVLIKNHSATVTGNVSSPSAKKDVVDQIGNQITEFEIVIADKVSVKDFDAQVGRIDELVSDNILVKEKLTAAEAEIGDLTADNVVIKESLTANKAEIEDLQAKKLDVDIADIKYATVESLDVTNADIHNLQADYGDFKVLTTDKFAANDASIKDLEAEKLSATEAELKYANIDFANINEAAIKKLFTDSGIIKDLIVSEGHITGELVGVTIKGDLIEAGTLKADKLVVKGSDGLYYKLNMTAEKVEALQTDQNSLDGSVITAKSITATKIMVDDLVAFDATIGGFNITTESIYSGVKSSPLNTTRGIYMDREGQLAIGDSKNFMRYYKDKDGTYKLELTANSITFGASGESVEDVIGNIQNDVDSLRDEITTLLRIESSRGTIFKNNTVSTVLSAVIYHGTQRITDSITMKEVFGNNAYLQWKWQRLDEQTFGVISSDDSRFGDNGFTFTLSPEDVDTKVTFMCELIT